MLCFGCKLFPQPGYQPGHSDTALAAKVFGFLCNAWLPFTVPKWIDTLHVTQTAETEKGDEDPALASTEHWAKITGNVIKNVHILIYFILFYFEMSYVVLLNTCQSLVYHCVTSS